MPQPLDVRAVSECLEDLYGNVMRLQHLLGVDRDAVEAEILRRLTPELDPIIVQAIRDSARDRQMIENIKVNLYKKHFSDDVRGLAQSLIRQACDRLIVKAQRLGHIPPT